MWHIAQYRQYGRRHLTKENHTRINSTLLREALSHLYAQRDVHASLPDFLDRVEELFRAVAVTWWVYDSAEVELVLAAASGGHNPIDRNASISAVDGPMGTILREGGIQVLEGAALAGNLPVLLLPEDEVTAVAVRIDFGDRPLGVLLTFHSPAASPAMEQLAIMELVATALGHAMEGNLLREEAEIQYQRLLLLQNLSQILQSNQAMDIRLKRLVDHLTEAFGASFGHILLSGEQGTQLRYLAVSGIGMDELPEPDVGPGLGIIGKVFESGEPKAVADVSEDADYILGHPDVRSEMAVPIRAEGEVIGVLNLESDQLDWFSDDDLRLAGIVASHTGVALKHALAYESALTRMRELELLNRVAQAIERIDDFSELLQAIVIEIQTSLAVSAVGIILLEDNQIDMRLHATAGMNGELPSDLKLNKGKGVTGAAVLTGEIQYVPDVTRDERYIPVDPRIRCELALPLSDHGIVIGVLNIESELPDAFSEEDRRVVEIVAAQISQILSKALLYEQLSTMAKTDGLTDLLNHREFFTRLETEFKRALRYSYPLSLIMMDIDQFKEFNDTYGHLKGDEILHGLAEIITVTMRETDVVARYGGDEFAAILPLCHESTAMEVAERLRATIEEADLTGNGESASITISLGVCTALRYADTYHELIKRADNAMYHSKNSGRNRCTFWSEDLELPAK